LCPHFLLFISSRCELVGFDFPLLARRARRPVEFSQILCPCSVAVASAGRPGLDFIRFWLHWLSHVRWLLSPDLVGVPSAAHRRVICFSRERGAGQHHRRFRSSFGWFRPRASFGAVRAPFLSLGFDLIPRASPRSWLLHHSVFLPQAAVRAGASVPVSLSHQQPDSHLLHRFARRDWSHVSI
jgi:hypothetical protein